MSKNVIRNILIATDDAALREKARLLLSGPGIHLIESSEDPWELEKAVNTLRRPRSDLASAPREAACELVGNSEAIHHIRERIHRIAVTDSSVLITGETGTGKELAAQMIHQLSPRRDQPFVSINCAALPEALVESELFGHERGAYTGAHSSYEGRLKLADGGTVFLDEVGDMSPPAQAKILRAIDTGRVEPLGGRQPVHINVRIVAATNQDLPRLATENLFRKDLYFRLSVAHVHLPPLRDHKEDIPALIRHWADEMRRKFTRSLQGFHSDALNLLMQHEWPGNVRELRNLIERMHIHCESAWVGAADLMPEMGRTPGGNPPSERDLLLSALMTTNWNKAKTAQKLSWSRMTVYRKMAKYQLAVTGPRPSDNVCDTSVTPDVTPKPAGRAANAR